MIERDLARVARRLSEQFPAVTITGPRQSGKTTLARTTFADLPYSSLEAPDVRELATEDPRGFLAAFPDGAVLDEVQRVPELGSYLQGILDAPGAKARFVLTGSQDFTLLRSLSQSLAGRTAVLHLMAPSLGELRRFGPLPEDLFEVLHAGAYPRIHEAGIAARDFHRGYVATYLERDVRQLLDVADLLTFQTFVGLCAGRAGSLLNLSGLGADAGVSQPTAKKWLSVLEAAFLVVRLPPWLPNLRKRLVRTPKLQFLDSGLLCYLLGIHDADQLRHHPLRGAVFESWVVSEVLKAHHHAGERPAVSFYRDRRGMEVDLVVERGLRVAATEVKSGRTVPGEALEPLLALEAALARSGGPELDCALVHGGDGEAVRRGVRLVPWQGVDGWARSLVEPA